MLSRGNACLRTYMSAQKNARGRRSLAYIKTEGARCGGRVTNDSRRMNFRRTANSCNVARRIPREDAGYRPPRNVAAIDFGTTNCSLAYIITGRSESSAPKNPNLLSFDGVFYRIPTAVLFGKNGSVTHFGETAREMYSNQDEEDQLECAYFEQIKMNLQQDEVGYTILVHRGRNRGQGNHPHSPSLQEVPVHGTRLCVCTAAPRAKCLYARLVHAYRTRLSKTSTPIVNYE